MNAVEALLAEVERIINDDLAPADIVDEIYTRQPDEQHAAAELVLRWSDIVADDVDDGDADADAAAKKAEDDAKAKVEGLIADGRAIPTQRDGLLQFARADAAGFDAFAKTLPQLVPVGKRQAKTEQKQPASNEHSLDPADPVVIEFRRRGLSDARIAETFAKTRG